MGAHTDFIAHAQSCVLLQLENPSAMAAKRLRSGSPLSGANEILRPENGPNQE